MTTSLLLELLAGVAAASLALTLLGRTLAVPALPAAPLAALSGRLRGWLLRHGPLASLGLLLLRLAVGLMMIHHGQDKLADPQGFATNYVAALHLPFPLVMAYAAGFAEIIGSWLVILGLFTPLGALALTGTMAVAALHHILTSGFNIYVLELVVLYLGGSVSLLLLGPGAVSFDAAIGRDLLPQDPAGSTAAAAGTAAAPAAAAA